MNNAALTENKEKVTQKEGFSFNWKNSPSIQRLLDTISSILAEEYTAIAKQNPTVFLEVSSGKMGQSPVGTVPIFPHNDGGKK